VEKVWWSGESLKKCGESLKKCGESLKKCGESLKKCGESLKKCEESLKKCGKSLEKKGKKSTKKIIAFEVGNAVFGTLSVEYMVEKVWKKWRKPNICVRLCQHVIDFVY
jgi:hypothetical protein